MVQEIFKPFVTALTNLATKRYQKWERSQNIEQKMNEVFSSVSPDIIVLANDRDFGHELFRLAAGETVDADKLVELGNKVQKEGKPISSEESIILNLKSFAYALINAWKEISPNSGDTPTAFSIFRDRVDQLVTEKRIIGSPPSPTGHEAADITISPINERGMNTFRMPIGSEVFRLEINFHVKSSLSARIVQVDLTYGSEGFPMAQLIVADGQEFNTDEDLRTLLKPIVLTEYQSKRMTIIREFLARLPEHFDKKDDDAWDALRVYPESQFTCNILSVKEMSPQH